MFRDLVKAFGYDAALALLALPDNHCNAWLTGSVSRMSWPARRTVWLVWSMVFRPVNLSTLFHVATWGKFTLPVPRAGGDRLRRSFAAALRPADWSGWEI